MVTERKSAMAAKKKNVSARRFTSENKLDNNRFNELAINGVKSRLEKVKELQDRTKRFAVAIVQFCSRLPQTGGREGNRTPIASCRYRRCGKLPRGLSCSVGSGFHFEDKHRCGGS